MSKVNYFELIANRQANGRVARLTEAGAAKLQNTLGRPLTDIELLNVKRKAQIVASLDVALANAASADAALVNKCECLGILCHLGDDKIANRADYRFQLPQDGWIHLAPLGEFDHPKGLVQV